MDRRKFFQGAVAGSAAFLGKQSDERKAELKTASFVIVELMGYKKLAGRLTQGVAGLLQLDIPVEGGMVTQMINPSSVYRITVVDERAVREAAKHVDPLPTIELEVPPHQMVLSYDDRDEYGEPF